MREVVRDGRDEDSYIHLTVGDYLAIIGFHYKTAMVHRIKHHRDEMTDLVKTISEADKKEFLRLMRECFKDG